MGKGYKGQFFKDGAMNRDPRPRPVVKTFEHPPKYTIKREPAKRVSE